MTCPYCNQPAMPLWRKCLLGPESDVACSSCGKKVSVPWIAIAAASPIPFGIVGAVRLDAPWSFIAPIAGLLAYVALQKWIVPLEGRERPASSR